MCQLPAPHMEHDKKLKLLREWYFKPLREMVLLTHTTVKSNYHVWVNQNALDAALKLAMAGGRREGINSLTESLKF